MGNILLEIVENKKREVVIKRQKKPLELLLKELPEVSPPRNFRGAISSSPQPVLIAEIKKASPSAGIIREEFNPVEIARIYEQSRAAAISILTDEKYFQGNLEHLKSVREKVDLPILQKEFIIDEYQIYEARIWGADAVLLIVSVLAPPQARYFSFLARKLGMDCLVEVHTENELRIALEMGAEIIGINNRNLEDFSVDLSTTAHLKEKIPCGKIVVSESGIQSAEDVLRLKSLKINAILIGETLLRSKDIGAKINELGLGVAN